MKTIQHDTRSLRHMAIERYLRTRNRIDRQHKQRALHSLLLVLIAAIVCFAILATRHLG